MKKIPLYGLTGNMGCGKSAFANLLGEFKDVAVFDADKIAREILRDKKHSRKLLELFGQNIFFKGGVSIRKVADLVFNDCGALKKLEDFIHPLVWLAIREKMENCKNISFCIVESALIFEAGWDIYFDAIIVVVCGGKEQRRRLRLDGWTEKEISGRLRRQFPLAEKIRHADFEIYNDGSMEELKAKAKNLYGTLKREF